MGARIEARPLPVDLVAVLDGSSSMNDATASGVSKWYATKAAFQDFLARAPLEMGFGLSVFPVPGDDAPSCSSARYRDAALPIRDVAEMPRAALAELDSVTPWGQTPTAPALTAALDLAAAHGLSHPDRSVVVVLATDGLPPPVRPPTPALWPLAKEALTGPAHVRTLVVASTSREGGDVRGFQRIAAAGGTHRPVMCRASPARAPAARPGVGTTTSSRRPARLHASSSVRLRALAPVPQRSASSWAARRAFGDARRSRLLSGGAQK